LLASLRRLGPRGDPVSSGSRKPESVLEEGMVYTDILYGVDDFVATIMLNRPDKLNAWTSEMDADVRRAIESAAADDAVRAIVFTGAGRGFCAGADMSRLSRLSAGETPRAIVGANGGKPGNFEQKFSYFLGVPKPIFAAINGPIAGIAFCLALFCDFRYMAEGAKLTTAFVRGSSSWPTRLNCTISDRRKQDRWRRSVLERTKRFQTRRRQYAWLVVYFLVQRK
jgi:1,4-dihydroxy-2-naphthoyl-CoA synthase